MLFQQALKPIKHICTWHITSNCHEVDLNMCKYICWKGPFHDLRVNHQKPDTRNENRYSETGEHLGSGGSVLLIALTLICGNNDWRLRAVLEMACFCCCHVNYVGPTSIATQHHVPIVKYPGVSVSVWTWMVDQHVGNWMTAGTSALYISISRWICFKYPYLWNSFSWWQVLLLGRDFGQPFILLYQYTLLPCECCPPPRLDIEHAYAHAYVDLVYFLAFTDTSELPGKSRQGIWWMSIVSRKSMSLDEVVGDNTR